MAAVVCLTARIDCRIVLCSRCTLILTFCLLMHELALSHSAVNILGLRNGRVRAAANQRPSPCRKKNCSAGEAGECSNGIEEKMEKQQKALA